MNFSQLMNSVELEQGEQSARARLSVSEDWLQGRTVFGGLQAALAVRAMRQQVDAAFVLRSMQVTFVGPVPMGLLEMQATVVRRGKSATHVRAEAVMGGQLCFTAVAIFGAPRDTAFTLRPKAPVSEQAPEAVASLPFIPNVTPAFTQNVEMRWAKGSPPFTGAQGTHSQIHVRHRNDPAMSEAHLVAACDIIPPPVLSMLKQPTAASSMNWQLELLIDPSTLHGEDWLRFDTEMIAAHSGYSWQTARIWSAQGELAAIAHQCVGVFG